jgi:hypothetical protein
LRCGITASRISLFTSAGSIFQGESGSAAQQTTYALKSTNGTGGGIESQKSFRSKGGFIPPRATPRISEKKGISPMEEAR